MGLFSWLFGNRFQSQHYIEPINEPYRPSPLEGNWQQSERGNPTQIYNGFRVTVFPEYKYWKFCVANEGAEEALFFSDPYEQQFEAQYEALAYVDGRPPRYESYTEKARQRRVRDLEEKVAQDAALLASGHQTLAEAATLTEIRKLERKVQSYLKQSHHHIIQLYKDRVSDDAIARAEAMEPRFKDLAEMINKKASEFKQRRKNVE